MNKNNNKETEQCTLHGVNTRFSINKNWSKERIQKELDFIDNDCVAANEEQFMFLVDYAKALKEHLNVC